MGGETRFARIADSNSTLERYRQLQWTTLPLTAGFVMVISALLAFNIVERQLPTDVETIWLPALAQVLVIWIVFLPLGYLAIDDDHIHIDYFYNKFPRSVRSVLDYFRLLLNLIVALALLVSAIQSTINFGATISPRKIPTYLVYLPVVIGMATLVAEYGRQAGAKVRADLW